MLLQQGDDAGANDSKTDDSDNDLHDATAG
jgi:hypothetical protein